MILLPSIVHIAYTHANVTLRPKLYQHNVTFCAAAPQTRAYNSAASVLTRRFIVVVVVTFNLVFIWFLLFIKKGSAVIVRAIINVVFSAVLEKYFSDDSDVCAVNYSETQVNR